MQVSQSTKTLVAGNGTRCTRQMVMEELSLEGSNSVLTEHHGYFTRGWRKKLIVSYTGVIIADV